MVQVILILEATILILVGFSSELELSSEESFLPEPLTAVVQFGKILKLRVENIYYPALLWRFNGKPVSEKCETMTTLDRSTMICTDMHWYDEGLYECQGITKSGHKEIILAVNVKVAECSENLSGKQRIMIMDSASQCFCSGITDECSMADDLFRSKITANVTKNDMVDLRITKKSIEESTSVDHETRLTTYYCLPKELKGNLLKSYGGYMDFPPIEDEMDEDKPDLVLKSKSQTLVYFNRQPLSEEISRNRISMTEQNWLQLNNTAISRSTFLMALSNVKEFYLKHNQYWNFEPIHIVMDSADYKDHGLGKVTTVEQCKCRPGYKGLSCESCSQGFYRRAAVLQQGICVSIREKLEPLAIALKKSISQIKNN